MLLSLGCHIAENGNTFGNLTITEDHDQGGTEAISVTPAKSLTGS